MKCYFQIALILIGILLLFSCKQRKVNEQPISLIKRDSTKSYSISLFGTLQTRRSFGSLSYLKTQQEQQSYYKKQKKSNPEFYYPLSEKDSILKSLFERIGLVRNETFLIKKLILKTTDTCTVTLSGGEKVRFDFYNDSATGKIWFNTFYKKESIRTNTDAFSTQTIDYTFLDLIPGGNKELVFLDDGYVSNNDLYNLIIYEIKTRD